MIEQCRPYFSWIYIISSHDRPLHCSGISSFKISKAFVFLYPSPLIKYSKDWPLTSWGKVCGKNRIYFFRFTFTTFILFRCYKAILRGSDYRLLLLRRRGFQYRCSHIRDIPGLTCCFLPCQLQFSYSYIILSDQLVVRNYFIDLCTGLHRK